jgi:hypothetical protein
LEDSTTLKLSNMELTVPHSLLIPNCKEGMQESYEQFSV